jgi:hypothetical protein
MERGFLLGAFCLPSQYTETTIVTRPWPLIEIHWDDFGPPSLTLDCFFRFG